jgi:hypothetical protein
MGKIGQLVADRLDLRRILLRHDDGPAVGMRQHMEMALSRIARIERHAHQVGDGRAQKEIGGLERVVLQHADAVLWPKAQCKKSIGQAHATLPCLGEGEPPVARRHCLALCVVVCGAAHLGAHIHHFLPRFASQCQSR